MEPSIICDVSGLQSHEPDNLDLASTTRTGQFDNLGFRIGFSCNRCMKTNDRLIVQICMPQAFGDRAAKKVAAAKKAQQQSKMESKDTAIPGVKCEPKNSTPDWFSHGDL